MRFYTNSEYDEWSRNRDRFSAARRYSNDILVDRITFTVYI